jgi:hypothetical protein
MIEIKTILTAFLPLLLLQVSLGCRSVAKTEPSAESLGKSLERIESRFRTAVFPDLADNAEFLLFVDGQKVLTNHVIWKPKSCFKSVGEGVLEGERVQMSTEIQCDSDGRWKTLRLKMPIHSTAIYLTGDDGADLVQPDGTTNSVILEPGSLPFPGLEGLNLFAIYYDYQKGGTQVFPVVVPHKKPREISLRLNRSFQVQIERKQILLSEFEARLGDEMTALMLVDQEGRLIRSEMPTEHSVFIRKEFLFLK